MLLSQFLPTIGYLTQICQVITTTQNKTSKLGCFHVLIFFCFQLLIKFTLFLSHQSSAISTLYLMIV